jgi:hypothetical protein
VSASDHDAVVLPGGQINPDLLRVEPKALISVFRFVRRCRDQVAITFCRAAWGYLSVGFLTLGSLELLAGHGALPFQPHEANCESGRH